MQLDLRRHYETVPNIFNEIRAFDDGPTIELAVEGHITRLEKKKRVVLLATASAVYLFKVRDSYCRLYRQWPFAFVSVEADPDADDVILVSLKPGPGYDPNGDVFTFGEDGKPTNEFDKFAVTTESAEIAGAAVSRFQAVKDALSLSLLGDSAEVDSSSREAADGGKSKADVVAAAAIEDEGNDEEDGGDGHGPANAKVDMSPEERRRALRLKRGVSKNTSGALRKLSPDRTMEISSLVDGEVRDFNVLRDAYVANKLQDLLQDVALFVEEHEETIVRLCRDYYGRFLAAAEQAVTVNVEDVETLSMSVDDATEQVADVARRLKDTGLVVTGSRDALQRLVAAHRQLVLAQRCVSAWERVEAQLEEKSLLCACHSLSDFQLACAPLAQQALGEYLLKERVPTIRNGILIQAAGALKMWLNDLRSMQRRLGQLVMAQTSSGGVNAKRQKVREIYYPATQLSPSRSGMTVDDSASWLVRDVIEAITVDDVALTYALLSQDASLTAAAAASSRSLPDEGGAIEPQADSLSLLQSKVFQGATLFDVYALCGKSYDFLKSFADARADQLRRELDVTAKNITDMKQFQTMCESLLGFLAIENLLYYAPSHAHVRTPHNLVATWDAITAKLTTSAATLRMSRPTEAGEMCRIVTRCVSGACDAVTCVPLNLASVKVAVHDLRDAVHSESLAALQGKLFMLCQGDSFMPLEISSPEQYQRCVVALNLHRTQSLVKVDPYLSGTIRVPYTALVPESAHAILTFVDEAYTIVRMTESMGVTDDSADAHIAEYVTVALGTVSSMASSMAKSNLSCAQSALLSSSMTAMLVVTSTIEQRYATLWHGRLTGLQKMGQPAILSVAAKEFSKVSENAVGSCVFLLMNEVDLICELGKDLQYWIKRADDPRDAQAKIFDLACEHIQTTVKVLELVWPPQLVQSTLKSTVMHLAEAASSIITNLVRNCEKRSIQHLQKVVIQYDGDANPLLPEFAKKVNVPWRVDISALCESLLPVIAQREAEYEEERKRQYLLVQGVEGITNVVGDAASQVQTAATKVATQTTKTVKWFGRGAKQAATAVVTLGGRTGAAAEAPASTDAMAAAAAA